MTMRSGSIAALLLLLAACVVRADEVASVEMRGSAMDALLPVLGETLQPEVGGKCLGCTIVLGLLNQRALQTGAADAEVVLSAFCKNITNPVGSSLCKLVNGLLGAALKKVDIHTSPDDTCQALKLCETSETCKLFKTWPPATVKVHPVHASSRSRVQIPGGDFSEDFKQALDLLLGPGGLKNTTHQVFSLHEPLATHDKDGDLHSTASTLRGTSWRGRDCDDSSASVYPGRRVSSDFDASKDTNCNGIYGVDPADKVAYEKKFCEGTQPRGVGILGDSAAAHFSLPPVLFTAADVFVADNWKGILHLLLNEGDWPECSWSTGYEDSANCPFNYASQDGVGSIYERMRERNRCNHRDLTNIGVNGARTTSMSPPDGTIRSFNRDPENDNPMLLYYAAIGNDVCNGHPGLDHMTTPEEFYTNVVAAMDYLNDTLPAGSHVVFLPLADGSLLYDTLHNHTHPIGVSYADFYSYLACQHSTPCWGWMNTNATWRAITQERANNLSAVYKKVIANNSYTQFDMVQVPTGYFRSALEKWVAAGGQASQLIEASDGFHPSTTANSLIAAEVWSWLEQNHPEALGPVNPHNAEISKVFGQQGGY